MSLIPALRRQRQRGREAERQRNLCEFEASLAYLSMFEASET